MKNNICLEEMWDSVYITDNCPCWGIVINLKNKMELTVPFVSWVYLKPDAIRLFDENKNMVLHVVDRPLATAIFNALMRAGWYDEKETGD